MISLAARARSVTPWSRLAVRRLALYSARLAGRPCSAYDRLASSPEHTAMNVGEWQKLTPNRVTRLIGDTFDIRNISHMIDTLSQHIDDPDAPFEHTLAQLMCRFRHNRNYVNVVSDLEFASTKWLQNQPTGQYREAAGAQHLQAHFSHILPRQGMRTQEQYMCIDQQFYGPSGTGKADLGGHILAPSATHFARSWNESPLDKHRITAFMVELKTPEGIESLCRALIQGIMYAQSESMLATLQVHARCMPGVTPWLMLVIGAGPGNLHLFIVSLPALLSLKAHLVAQVNPVVKLPMYVLSSPHSMSAGEESVSVERVLRSGSLVNPYKSEGLANFAQTTSFIGRRASVWAGVSDMGAERKAELARILEAGSVGIHQRPVLGGDRHFTPLFPQLYFHTERRINAD